VYNPSFTLIWQNSNIEISGPKWNIYVH
jgi:hypothetical protein